MSKSFEEMFDDSTDMAFYNIAIVSENGQEQEFDGVTHDYAKQVFELLAEQASESELK